MMTTVDGNILDGGDDQEMQLRCLYDERVGFSSGQIATGSFQAEPDFKIQ